MTPACNNNLFVEHFYACILDREPQLLSFLSLNESLRWVFSSHKVPRARWVLGVTVTAGLCPYRHLSFAICHSIPLHFLLKNILALWKLLLWESFENIHGIWMFSKEFAFFLLLWVTYVNNRPQSRLRTLKCAHCSVRSVEPWEVIFNAACQSGMLKDP